MPSPENGSTATKVKTQGFYGIMARAIVQGTKSVMSSMAGLETKPGTPSIKRTDQEESEVIGIMNFAVSGVIGFAGEGRGPLALSFSRECALGLTAALFGDQKTEIDKEVEDTIGEFTNMICGDARRRMSEHGVSMEAGLPTVVSGDGHSLNHVSAGFSFVIPFTSPHGAFALEASVEPN